MAEIEPDRIHSLFQENFQANKTYIVLTECNRLTRGKRLRTTPLDEGLQIPAANSDCQAGLEKQELTRLVLLAISKLSPNERMVVMLFYMKEYSQSEISAFLEVPLTTVAKRLYSARARLRGMIMDKLQTDLRAHCPSRNATFAESVKAGIYDEYVGDYRFELRPELVVTVTVCGRVC